MHAFQANIRVNLKVLFLRLELGLALDLGLGLCNTTAVATSA